ncbi:helix-turn-helix transcriptional regulator [Bacillus subtilis]
MINIGSKLKALRERNGWTQRYTAEKMGVSPQMYNNYEKNKTKLSLEKTEKICDLYNISLDTLTSEYEDLDEFSEAVAISSNEYKYFDESKNEDDKHTPFLIPSFSGFGYEMMELADNYNSEIDYTRNEFFFFENNDPEYAPERLRKGDLLYCEGVDPNEDPGTLDTYLIYNHQENRYYVRRFLDSNLFMDIIRSVDDEKTNKKIQNILKQKKIEELLILIPDQLGSQNLLICTKEEISILGKVIYVIFSPMVDAFGRHGLDFKKMARKKFEDETKQIQNRIRQTNPKFLRD